MSKRPGIARQTLWRQALWCFAHGFPKCGRRYLLKAVTGA